MSYAAEIRSKAVDTIEKAASVMAAVKDHGGVIDRLGEFFDKVGSVHVSYSADHGSISVAVFVYDATENVARDIRSAVYQIAKVELTDATHKFPNPTSAMITEEGETTLCGLRFIVFFHRMNAVDA